MRSVGVTVAVARLESVRAQNAFERFRLYDVLPKDHVFHSVDEAIHALAREGIDSHYIGQVTPREQGVVLVEGNQTRQLPVFPQDEITRLFAGG